MAVTCSGWIVAKRVLLVTIDAYILVARCGTIQAGVLPPLPVARWQVG